MNGVNIFILFAFYILPLHIIFFLLNKMAEKQVGKAELL